MRDINKKQLPLFDIAVKHGFVRHAQHGSKTVYMVHSNGNSVNIWPNGDWTLVRHGFCSTSNSVDMFDRYLSEGA